MRFPSTHLLGAAQCSQLPEMWSWVRLSPCTLNFSWGVFPPRVSAFLVPVLGWSCANAVGEELMCEQGTTALSVQLLRHQRSWGEWAPKRNTRRSQFLLGPPTRESSPESRAGALCLGKCVCSLLSHQKMWWLARRSAELQRGNVDVQLSSPAQGCLKTVRAGKEQEMLRNEWVLTNKKSCWRWKWRAVGRLILLWCARSGMEEEAFKPRAFPPNSEREFHMLLIVDAFKQNTAPSHSGSWN